MSRRTWANADTRTLRRLAASGLSLREIAERMGRDRRHIRERAARHDIEVHRVIAPRFRWTPKAEAKLRKLFPVLSAEEIAARLGCKLSSIHNRAHKLGLRKSKDWVSQRTAKRWQEGRHEGSRAHCFQKGTVPHNKGLRRPGYAPGNMAKTQFKKGRPASQAHNYVPIGTEKYDPKRKVLVRKITDDPSIYPAARWRPVHVMVWEAVHGKVPTGHIVIFRPGMKSLVAREITIDRIELVTLRENMRRNTIHNLPKDLAQVVQLRGVLIRKINRKEKQNEKQDRGSQEPSVRNA